MGTSHYVASPSSVKPRPFTHSELHPTSVWLVVTKATHHTEKDLSELQAYLFYTEERAKKKARTFKDKVVFMGEYQLSKEYRINGGINGTRRSRQRG